ncbi:MAG TPA: DNA-binding protein [candidate division Zixibacteria bacterium]|nr:DNA-binding protein [candidate division Zixibacteria bacterium]HBZ01640.1 DNA-binding protein [candidate division Zixibacteria bacterium]
MTKRTIKRTIKLTPVESIQQKIFMIRGHKVMLSIDLAALYGVEAKVLNQAVKRNIERFPGDFMFQLTGEEADSLRSQIVTLKSGRGKHSKYPPYAFTEQGVAMLSSVLKSDRAIAVNIMIMRAFVKLREILLTHKELARKLAQLEAKFAGHDHAIQNLFAAIRQLMASPVAPAKRRIGFTRKESKSSEAD